jgi:hypothetical protein
MPHPWIHDEQGYWAYSRHERVGRDKGKILPHGSVWLSEDASASLVICSINSLHDTCARRSPYCTCTITRKMVHQVQVTIINRALPVLTKSFLITCLSHWQVISVKKDNPDPPNESDEHELESKDYWRTQKKRKKEKKAEVLFSFLQFCC